MKQRKDKGGYHSIFKEMRAHKAGRQCKYPGCTTVLSVYNRSRHCRLHTDVIAFEELKERDARLPYWVEKRIKGGKR
jgi:hypothetical protein